MANTSYVEMLEVAFWEIQSIDVQPPRKNKMQRIARFPVFKNYLKNKFMLRQRISDIYASV